MQRVTLLDSVFTRLVAWAIAVSIVVVLVLGGLVTAKFEQITDFAVKDRVNEDIIHLADVLNAQGESGLVLYIDEMQDLTRTPGRAAHYLAQDADGRRIAGSMARWPAFPDDDEQAGHIVLADGRHAYARAVQLSPDIRLVAARETGAGLAQLNQIGLAFVVGGIFVVLAVGVAGYLTARRLSRRVRRINAAFRNPAPNKLTALGQGKYERDEIGELTRHSSEALARLDRLARAHRDTADQIAHEIRTPLMHLDNRLVRAIQSKPDAETTGRLIEARGEIRHVVATLESLLDIAHNEAQRGDPGGLQHIDLSDMAEQIVDLYQASAEDTGHVLLLESDAGVTMTGDAMQISRVITNLLDNAFKYVPTGGTVRLIVRKGPVIEVADDGPGVPPEYRETIFERFGRGSEEHASSRKGAGLGLALARAIAERHNMELRLAPSVRGARFQLRMPPRRRD